MIKRNALYLAISVVMLFSIFSNVRSAMIIGDLKNKHKEVEVITVTEAYPVYIAQEPEFIYLTVENSIPKQNYRGYDIYDVTISSGLTELDIRRYLDRFPELMPVAPILAEWDTKGINAIFALAVLRLESGNGKKMAAQNNVGSVVCFNKGEYLEYGSINEGTNAWCQLINSGYLSQQGIWHEGVGVEDIRTHYNPGQPQWTQRVIDIMEQTDSYFNNLYIN